jgi:hypothetical protein
MGSDVVDSLSVSSSGTQSEFDVFICYNSRERSTIQELNTYFKQSGLTTWLDEERLPLGRPWQMELERQIGEIRTVTVCVGNSGIGPWQDLEIRAFLSEFVRRGIPVIPVILASAKSVPELPLFLREMTWVDLRKDSNSGLVRLVDAIRNRSV